MRQQARGSNVQKYVLQIKLNKAGLKPVSRDVQWGGRKGWTQVEGGRERERDKEEKNINLVKNNIAV